MNINDRMRISDSDRDRAATQLRDYYAEGRLTTEELDERVTAALSAKTAGDLRRLMSDLPAPAAAASGPGAPPDGAAPWGRPRPTPAWGGPGPRGPRVLPILALLLIAAILVPGGWVFFALLKVFLLFWLLVALVGMVAGLMFRHKARRFFRDRAGQWQQGQQYQGQNWRGPGGRGRNW